MVKELSLREKVNEVISDMMPDERKEQLRLSWEEIDEYDRLAELGLDEFAVLELATQLESVFDYLSLTELEIDNWVLVRDVFESVEIQESKKGV